MIQKTKNKSLINKKCKKTGKKDNPTYEHSAFRAYSGSNQHKGLGKEFFTTRLIQRRHTEENIFASVGIWNGI